MKFASLLVVNHKKEVEKALTISQIKELLEYEVGIKHSARKLFEDVAKEYEEGSEEFEVNMRMALCYEHEMLALCQLAVRLDELVD